MSDDAHLGWYSVRCVFAFGSPAGSAPATYEERITLWCARSAEEAIARAEAEALEYVALLEEPPSTYTGLAQCYQLADEPGDRAEVFSLMRDSQLEPDDYVDGFFETGRERQRTLE